MSLPQHEPTANDYVMTIRRRQAWEQKNPQRPRPVRQQSNGYPISYQIKKIEGLVKIYENMKPKNAARIFEELDMDTLLMVTESMGARRLAPIMAKMNPARATEITVELSRLRKLPSEALKVGG